MNTTRPPFETLSVLPDLTPPQRDEPEVLDALGYLQGVYRGKIIAESPRMRAAIAALPFERPKLAVVVNLNNFADHMEELSRRAGRSNVIDAPQRDFQRVEVLKGKG
jgi:hypothetical protein